MYVTQFYTTPSLSIKGPFPFKVHHLSLAHFKNLMAHLKCLFYVIALPLVFGSGEPDLFIQDSFSSPSFASGQPSVESQQPPAFSPGFESERCLITPMDPDADCIPGRADTDYPTLSEVPLNQFDCREQPFPGLYADIDFRCQVYHVCNLEREKFSFLCPRGTILDQRSFVCVWWFNFNCADAPGFYFLNEGFYNTSIPLPQMSLAQDAPIHPPTSKLPASASHTSISSPQPQVPHVQNISNHPPTNNFPTPVLHAPSLPAHIVTSSTASSQPSIPAPQSNSNPVDFAPGYMPDENYPADYARDHANIPQAIPSPNFAHASNPVHNPPIAPVGHGDYEGTPPRELQRVPIPIQIPHYPQPAYPPSYAHPANPGVPMINRPADYY